jgi:hypothetical protein
MAVQAPGELTAVDIAVLSVGAVAEAVINERTECFARLHADGAWSGWQFVVNGVKDVSVTADTGPSALIAVVMLVPLPPGAFAAGHAFYQDAFFLLTPAGVSRAAL